MGKWRAAPGFPNYEVSDDGQIRNSITGLVLAQREGSAGYVQLHISDASGTLCYPLLHRLICLAFHGEMPFEGAHAAHNNGNPKDNRAENLRWASPRENVQDKRRHGTQLVGEAVGNAKLTEESVSRIRDKYYAGYRADDLAREYGVARATIYRAINRESWAHVR